MATATKQLGLELFSNQLFRMEVEKQLGEEFVQACLDLAITQLPPEPDKSSMRKAHANTGYKHKSWWYQNQLDTVYNGNWVKTDRKIKPEPKANTTAYLTEEQKQDIFLFQQEAIKQDKADKVALGYIAPTKKTMKHQSIIHPDGYVPKETREVPVRIKRKRI